MKTKIFLSIIILLSLFVINLQYKLNKNITNNLKDKEKQLLLIQQDSQNSLLLFEEKQKRFKQYEDENKILHNKLNEISNKKENNCNINLCDDYIKLLKEAGL